MPRAQVLYALMLASVVYLIAIPFFGWLADRIGQRSVIGFGCTMTIIFSGFYFKALGSGSIVIVFLSMCGALSLAHASLQAPQASLFSSWFPVEQRYTGVALAQAIPTTIVGGTVPLIATLLSASSGGTYLIGVYVGTLAILGLICAFAAGRTASRAPSPIAVDGTS
jgi:MFS family permease